MEQPTLPGCDFTTPSWSPIFTSGNSQLHPPCTRHGEAFASGAFGSSLAPAGERCQFHIRESQDVSSYSPSGTYQPQMEGMLSSSTNRAPGLPTSANPPLMGEPPNKGKKRLPTIEEPPAVSEPLNKGKKRLSTTSESCEVIPPPKKAKKGGSGNREPPAGDQPLKKGPGRPPGSKNKPKDPNPPPKRPRGRPPKNPLPAQQSLPAQQPELAQQGPYFPFDPDRPMPAFVHYSLEQVLREHIPVLTYPPEWEVVSVPNLVGTADSREAPPFPSHVGWSHLPRPQWTREECALWDAENKDYLNEVTKGVWDG